SLRSLSDAPELCLCYLADRRRGLIAQFSRTPSRADQRRLDPAKQNRKAATATQGGRLWLRLFGLQHLRPLKRQDHPYRSVAAASKPLITSMLHRPCLAGVTIYVAICSRFRLPVSAGGSALQRSTAQPRARAGTISSRSRRRHSNPLLYSAARLKRQLETDHALELSGT